MANNFAEQSRHNNLRHRYFARFHHECPTIRGRSLVAAKRARSEDELLLANIDRLVHEPARFMIMAYLYVVESADFLFLQRQTGMTWGNLSSHLSKLETAKYIAIEKSYLNKKPHTMLLLAEKGRTAFEQYRRSMKRVLDNLPE